MLLDWITCYEKYMMMKVMTSPVINQTWKSNCEITHSCQVCLQFDWTLLLLFFQWSIYPKAPFLVLYSLIRLPLSDCVDYFSDTLLSFSSTNVMFCSIYFPVCRLSKNYSWAADLGHKVRTQSRRASWSEGNRECYLLDGSSWPCSRESLAYSIQCFLI